MYNKETRRVDWIQVAVPNPQIAMQWFCDNFGFEYCSNMACGIKNGNCRMLFVSKDGRKKDYTPDVCFAGYEHIALEAQDINNALQYCKEQGMELETDEECVFYNPKIWGTGMNYFNILTPWGLKVEIAQRLDRKLINPKGKNIAGLDHLGIEVSNIEESIEYYQNLGFIQACPRVQNLTDQGAVLCTMLKLDDFIIELYQFVLKKDYRQNLNNGVQGIVFSKRAGDEYHLLLGPDGEVALG